MFDLLTILTLLGPVLAAPLVYRLLARVLLPRWNRRLERLTAPHPGIVARADAPPESAPARRVA
jgi:hypothetical protein